jgi:phosphohistidine phosphatase
LADQLTANTHQPKMKTLFLIRHAKSSWEDPYQKDMERVLNERGKRDAPRMGKRLKEREVNPDFMLTSPAVRALSTCETIAGIIGYKKENIRTDRKLYHASDEQILTIIKKLSDKHNEVMLFGHNPGLSEFVERLKLTAGSIGNIPTCGVVAFELPVESWKAVKWKMGELVFYDYPKNKDH